MTCLKRGLQTSVFCLLIAGSASTLSAADLVVNAGLGYEFLSQQYFLDSAAASGPDSTLEAWSLNSTYLDDLKGQVTASWFPLDDPQRLELRTSLEQTADFLRLKTNSHFRLRPGRGKVDLDSELEWRNRVGRSDASGDGYFCTFSRLKGLYPVGHAVAAVGRLRLESVNFASMEPSRLNYVRLGGNLGIEKTWADYSWGEISLLYVFRNTPDSSAMDYQSVGAEASLYGFLPTGQLDLTVRLELKDYNQPDNGDDHSRIEGYGRNRIALGDRWFTRQEVDLEGMLYSADDDVTADFLRLGGATLLGIETGGLTAALGPEMETLIGLEAIDVSLSSVAEDYLEVGGKIDADFLGRTGIFLSLESNTGFRTVQYESELQTSFRYERMYLLADIKIISVLNLATLFSAEWEWHDDSQNNSELYLLSTSLTYSF